MKNRYLELQIDAKKLEQGEDLSLVKTFAYFISLLGITFNASRQVWLVPKEIQHFSKGFFSFLEAAKELGALQGIKNLSGCYAKELSSPLILEGETLSKPSNDGTKHLYIFKESEMPFAEFVALEGTLFSNKNNDLSKLEDYIVNYDL